MTMASALPAQPALPAARSARAEEVEVVSAPEALEAHRADWEELSRDCVEPNVFYEPWALLPAIAALGRRARLRFVLVRRQPKGPPRKGMRPLLIGFFPLELLPPSARVPVPSLALWRHRHAFLTAPLLRRGYGPEALAAFFDWLERQRIAPGPLTMNKVPGDGPIHGLLSDELERRGWLFDVERRYTRAVLRPTSDDPERYLARAVPGKRRKELRRQLRRLSELGPVEFRELGAGGDARGWVERFAAMEADGWKGREGDAFHLDPDALGFLRELAAGGHRRGRLMMTALEVGGRPIAYKLNLLSGEGAFAFKIAHDRRFGRYSPGVLLELDAVERICRHPRARWMDSCAGFDHPMIDGLWSERRAIEQLTVSPGRLSDAVLSLRMMLRLGRRAIGGRR